MASTIRPDIVTVTGLGVAELLMLGIIMLILVAVVAFPAGRICSRLGFSPWLGLIALVPVANVALLLFIAFAKWPAFPTPDGSSGRS